MTTNNKGGRPSKFDKKRTQAILDAISNHAPYRIAAQANGISERTFYYWLKHGEHDMDNEIDSEYTRFLQSLRRLEAEKITECVNKIKSSSTGHRGCQWFLEHVFWKYFSASAPVIDLAEQMHQLKDDILINRGI